MAETFLSPLISKLFGLLGEEVNLLQGVYREVESLKDELEILQPFLKQAEAKADRGEMDETTRAWVRQLREEADRAEGIVDEYLYHVEERRLLGGFVGVLRKASCFFSMVRQRAHMASEIRDVKEKLGRIKERGQSYGLRCIEQGSSSKAADVEAPDPRLGSLFTEKDELVGIDSLLTRKLIEGLVEGPPSLSVVSLVGQGGIGKTILAKSMYGNQVVVSRFDVRFWIPVSQSYNQIKLLKSMIRRIGLPAESITVGSGVDELISLLRQHLETKRYLFVFDDVWHETFWDEMKYALPSNNKGSTIIITTRNASVVDSCKEAPCYIFHELKPWSLELAFELFCKRAFRCTIEGRCPEELEKLSREIVSKCQGLPLVIAAVAGLLSTKEKVIFEWQKVLENFDSGFQNYPKFEGISKVLSLSYNDLPMHIKPCYLYFGIFPKKFFIHDQILYRLWIAEGFVESKKDKTLEKVAEEYLNELISRNLVLFELHSGVRWCHVHDLMADIILTRAGELRFVQILDENPKFEGKSRRLSVYNTATNLSRNHEDSRVGSVFLFDILDLIDCSVVTMCRNFKLLKVLHFDHTPLKNLPNEVGILIHLKYLSLRGTYVRSLLSSIGKLRNLQTLDIRNTLVQVLHWGLHKLCNLRHLLAGRDYGPSIEHHDIDYNVPHAAHILPRIGDLKELQTLTMVTPLSRDTSKATVIRELGKLAKLKTLGISLTENFSIKSLCSCIKNMNHLEELHLTSDQQREVFDLSCISSPPLTLRIIQIHCQLKQLPAWISELQNLKRLDLAMSGLIDDPLGYLQDVPNLAYLRLRKAYEGEELHFKEGGFQRLKELHLRKLEGLKAVKIDRGALPLLEKFHFGPFPLMKEMPSDIHHLMNLKSLEINDMPREFVIALQPDGGPDYWKIQHVPSVCFRYKRQGTGYNHYKLKLDSSDLLQHLQEQRDQ